MNAGVASTRRQAVGQAIDELDLGALGQALWRRRRWIIGLTLLAVGLAFIAVNLITPRYKSEARVLVETRENIFLRPDAEKTTERGVTVDQEAVTSQVQLILSRDLARAVIKKLKLGERPEFYPALRATSVIRVLLGRCRAPADRPLEALARSYDHVVIDVGAPLDAAAERLAQLAPRAVLIADRLTALSQARLLSSGFAAVNVLQSAPAAPQSNATGTRAAA